MTPFKPSPPIWGVGYCSVFVKFKNYTQMNKDKLVKEGNLLISHFMEEKSMAYHNNWKCLMPVVEKISDTSIGKLISEQQEDGGYAYPVTFGMRTEIGEWMVRYRGFGLHTAPTLIDAIWEASVDFITLYNQQKIAN